MAAPAPAPATDQQVNDVLQRLSSLPGKIHHAEQQRHNKEQYAELQRKAHAIEVRVQTLAAHVGGMAGAQRALQALRERIVHPQAGQEMPTAANIATLDGIIAALNPAALNHALQGLQQEVIALETAVGLTSAQPPGPLGPPAGQPFQGGYKNTSRARTARAKRLKTRKRLHSLHHSRRHHRRKHKKRTHRRRRRKRRR